jgi:hypothetical protein
MLLDLRGNLVQIVTHRVLLDIIQYSPLAEKDRKTRVENFPLTLYH